MRGTNRLFSIGRQAMALAMLAAISGCSLLNPAPEVEPATPPVVVTPAQPDPVVIIEPVPEPVPEAKPAPVEPVPAPEPVAIVVSGSQPAFADVARELAELLQPNVVHNLADKDRPPVSVLRGINDSNVGTVVAIGLRAAQSAVAMSDRPVVFSQVFNYREHDLLTANSRGVAAIPPAAAQLENWLAVDTTLTRIGMIVGEGHDDLLREASAAADKLGVELHLEVARSDQETLYLFKRMARSLDGYWLVPDNRILSGRVLQALLDEAGRHKVAVLVPNDSMLALGAAVSMTTVAANVAARIAEVVRAIEAGGVDAVAQMTPLTEVRTTVNPALAPVASQVAQSQSESTEPSP